MDVVWIRLNVVTMISTPTLATDDLNEEYFMFGPTGVVRFKRHNNVTQLFNSAKLLVAEVSETPEYIMDLLRKIRQTSGRLEIKKKRTKK